jgi:hypothetical protein
LTPADVNNDGYASQDTMSVHLNDANGNFSGEETFYRDLCTLYSVTLADLHNDSSLDIIIVFLSDNKIVVLFNTGNGIFVVDNTFVTDAKSLLATLVNINNDKKLDLVAAHFGSNNIGIYFNKDNNYYIY